MAKKDTYQPGLSPRTRGSRLGGAGVDAPDGPIPADAGEPELVGCRARHCGAYPRGRGGAIVGAHNLARRRGLSPRTRGSLAVLERRAETRGPIPADAGEPAFHPGASRSPRAYPRGRGGAGRCSCSQFNHRGLSPRTRGSRCHGDGGAGGQGPIPADAREPRGADNHLAAVRAYPRGRGGAAPGVRGADGKAGLSPRTRGSRLLRPEHEPRPGPIPADAGEPACGRRSPPCRGAYPRGRGGANCASSPGRRTKGLSPRTRGSHQVADTRRGAAGPIPADAGEPCPRWLRLRRLRAYPRGRGGARHTTTK